MSRAWTGVPLAERQAATAAARHAVETRAANRAVDDPVALARAARIVRVALERKRLTLADLTEPDQQAS